MDNVADARWETRELVCPNCRRRLVVGDGDRVFTCPQCEAGFELGFAGLEPLSANQVYLGWWLRSRPEGPAGAAEEEIVRLPFWRFELRAPRDGRLKLDELPCPRAVSDRLRDERFDLDRRRVFAYLPAFRTRHPVSALRTAAALTDCQPEYELIAGARSRGAAYNSTEAARLLDLAVLELAESSPGMALTGCCPRRRPELVSLPFEQRGAELVESVSGTRFAAAELDLAEPD